MGWSWGQRFVASLLVLGTISIVPLTSAFKEEPPQFNYDTLPKTSFSCQGKVPGRYYADPETDCQLFHVCVKMSAKDTNDFKFLCPNGTTFDQEHQVCMDYYQVVCQEGSGANPLGHIFEFLKLSSLHQNQNSGLDSEKVSYVDPDAAERNTLGDDFQVQEYNTNNLAASQNSLNYQSGKSHRKSSQDIFYKFQEPATRRTTYRTTTTTTTTTTTLRPTTSSTTAAPLLFRSPIPTTTNNNDVSTKRKPNLETYESYEIESVAGLTQQNSFNRLGGQPTYKHYDYSYESQDPEPSPSTTTTTTTTHRPLIFHNTFRSPLPVSSSTSLPPVQTFQQQASRFNEDFFRKIPTSTEPSSAVSKAAQFYIHSSTKYNTPDARRPSTNPFSTTTETPFYSHQNEPSRHISHVDRNLSNRGSATYQSTTSRPFVSDFSEHDRKRFSAQISSNLAPADDAITARRVSGNTIENSVNQAFGSRNHQQYHQQREPATYSTVPPPTTAEPYAYSTTDAQGGSTYFQRLTTLSRATVKSQNDYTDGTSTVDYYEPTSTYRSDIDAGFGQKATNSRVTENSYQTTEYTTEASTTTTPRPQRRGSRRRVQRPKQQQPPTRFDPALKYSRRVETVKDKSKDEIFEADASVFPGRPASNLFLDEKHAVGVKAEETVKPTSERTVKLAENFGRKIRVNNIRRQFTSTQKPEEEASTTTTTTPESTKQPRRLIKRIKVKATTPNVRRETTTTEDITTASTTTTSPSTTTSEVTTTEAATTTPAIHSTLRPVKRINVKTKIGTRKYVAVKDSEFRVPPVVSTQPKSSLSVFEKLKKYVTTVSASSTTTPVPEPEVVTASQDDALFKKLRKQETLKTNAPIPTTTFRPFEFHNSSSTVVVKVTHQTHKDSIPTPISFKEPILPKLDRIVEVKTSVREDSTRSPDYDYAYYNTDDNDYTDAAGKLDPKNFGKKPVKKGLPSPA